MSQLLIDKADGYAAGFPTEGSLFIRRKGQLPANGPGLICLHGRGGNCLQYSPHDNRDIAVGYHSWRLALEGFRIFAIDDMGATDWGSQDSTSRINDAITWLQSTGGAKPGKVGLMGWSMGSIAALNWADQNSDKHACSWLWAPATDLEYFHSIGTYTAEIDAAYSTEGTRVGNSPIAQASNYRGIGKIHMVHAVDDTTIPIQQSRDFVSAVNHVDVDLEESAIGNHTALFGHPTDSAIALFFRNNLGIPI